MDSDPAMSNHGEVVEVQHQPSEAFRQWEHFLSRCTIARLEADKFAEFAPIMHARTFLRPESISYLFLRPTPDFNHSLDPRVLMYIHILLTKKYIDTLSLLRAMYMFSTSLTRMENGKPKEHNASKMGPAAPRGRAPVLRWANSYWAEEPIFYMIVREMAHGRIVVTRRAAAALVGVLAKWMTLFASVSAAMTAEEITAEEKRTLFASASADFATIEVMNASIRDTRKTRMEMEGSRIAFVSLVLRIFDAPAVLEALADPRVKPLRKYLSDAMESFLPSVVQGLTPDVVQKLDMFRTQTLASLDPDLRDRKNAEMDNMIDPSMALEAVHVPDIHIPNTRAALYVYLNATLIGRPAIDDQSLFAYLNNRYHGDIQNMATDLILASFDVLANAVFRNESAKAAPVLRSYLINKVPLLLKTLSHAMFPPLTAEHCIREALRQVDQNAFPTMSDMFDSMNSNNTFTDSVRQDFCFACALHHLIPVTSIHGLLGDMTYQKMPEGGRYEKNTLVRDCLANPERMQSLVSELDNTDGNVGAVSQALVEVMKRLCQNKETLPLKSLVTMLSKKPLSLDVLLLFESPVSILRPLCDLLDSWRYDEDQGEYQPVYEEFGAVLLLLLSFVHRYNFTASDLGLHNSRDSFVAKLLSSGYLSRTLEDLSEKESEHLGGWIHGLFDPEGGGLTDELMSSCPPQDFYLLVPTLFKQIILALSSGMLTEESLKSGMEYLVDDFLIPSLIPVLTFLGTHLWVDRPAEQKEVIRILQLILLPTSTTSEATSLLSAVITTIAQPLDHSLRTHQRRDPKNQNIEPLLGALKDALAISRRTTAASHHELESWTATQGPQGGGLAIALRSTLVGLVSWALAPGLNAMPTAYTHRQVLACLRLLGAGKTLRHLVDEIVQVANAVTAAAGGIGPDGNGAATHGASAGGQGRQFGPASGTKRPMNSNGQVGKGAAIPPPPPETLGVVYDVVCALICAPDSAEVHPPPPTPSTPGQPPALQNGDDHGRDIQQNLQTQQRTGLREALRHAAEDAAVKKGGAATGVDVEVTIQLYRRVEALLAPLPLELVPTFLDPHQDDAADGTATAATDLMGGSVVGSGEAANSAAATGDNASASAAAAVAVAAGSLDVGDVMSGLENGVGGGLGGNGGGGGGGMDLGDLEASGFGDLDLSSFQGPGTGEDLLGFGSLGSSTGVAGTGAGADLFDWDAMDIS